LAAFAKRSNTLSLSTFHPVENAVVIFDRSDAPVDTAFPVATAVFIGS
jgi:hypothetical protein